LTKLADRIMNFVGDKEVTPRQLLDAIKDAGGDEIAARDTMWALINRGRLRLDRGKIRNAG
jgi:nucleoside-diphosphate-sugar epimerase